jgi:hypothetical protein
MSRQERLDVADALETRHGATGDFDGFDEHFLRTNPESGLTVERLVNDEDLQRLGVAGEAEHAVFVSLVMTITAGARFVGQGRQIIAGRVRRIGTHGYAVQGSERESRGWQDSRLLNRELGNDLAHAVGVERERDGAGDELGAGDLAAQGDF